MKGVISMRKSAEIKVVLHFSDNKADFDKIYIEAVMDAIKQLAEKVKA